VTGSWRTAWPGWRYRAKRVVPWVLRHALGRRRFVRLTRFLYNEARLDTPNVEIRHNGELLVQRVVAENAPSDRGLVVFDVGAHVGEWTSHLLDQCEARGVERVRTFCFEPCPDSRLVLERSLVESDGGEGTAVVGEAVSDTVGTVELHITGGGVSSLYEQATRPTIRIELVATTTLDSFCAHAGIDRIDLVKVDTEGHDMAVLRGAKRLLEHHAIGVLQFEYNHRWVMPRAFLRDAFALLAPLGYRVGKVTPRGIEFYRRWHPDLETFSQGNYVACTEAWARRFPAIPWYADA
jgi:FkbM family methyltransferase